MKKYPYFFFILISISTIFAQTKPIVQVDPIVNLSGEAWLDAVCLSATDGVSLTLSLIGQFKVSRDEPDQLALINLSILKSRAESEGYDNIIFGSTTIEDDSYVIVINAYDLALDKISYSGSTVVRSILETFEAVDQITTLTVEGFSGIHVTYGSLVLAPPDTGEPFSFTIDDVSLPDGIFSIDKMPSGAHKLTVYQERPLGLYEAIHNIVVDEETENNIIIPISQITGEEVSIFNQVDQEMRSAVWKAQSDTDQIMHDLNSLLETPFFKNYRQELIEKYKRLGVLFGDETKEALDLDNFKMRYKNISFWDSENYETVFNNNATLLSQFRLIFLSEEQLAQEQINILDNKNITINGESNDWHDVSTIFYDGIGDIDITQLFDRTNENEDGHDFYWVGASVDENNIYFAMETVNQEYRDGLQYEIYLTIAGNLLKIIYDEEEELTSGYIVLNGDWDNAYNFTAKNSSLKGESGNIVEISFPLDKIIELMRPMIDSISLNYKIVDSSYNTTGNINIGIDNFTTACIFPSIYYAIREEEL